MTRLATSWLVYRLTHSALLLGVVSFAGQIVSFALGPFAGVWVERLNRRKLLVWTQAAAAVQSLALAALTLAHVITLWEIIALIAFQGLINAFDMPGRQSFLVQMVEDRPGQVVRLWHGLLQRAGHRSRSPAARPHPEPAESAEGLHRDRKSVA